MQLGACTGGPLPGVAGPGTIRNFQPGSIRMGPHQSYDSSAANLGPFAAAGYSGLSAIGNYHPNHMVQGSGNVSGMAPGNVPVMHPGSNAMGRSDNFRPNSAV